MSLHLERRTNVVGFIAVLCAATACAVAIVAVGACVMIAIRGGQIVAEQINVLSMAIGITGTFVGFTGALLATPTAHGRATDPNPDAAITATTRVETHAETENEP